MLGADTTASSQLRLVYKLQGLLWTVISPVFLTGNPWWLGLGMAKDSVSLNFHWAPSSGGGCFHCCGLAVFSRAKASPFPEQQSQPADLSAQQWHADLSGVPEQPHLHCLSFWYLTPLSLFCLFVHISGGAVSTADLSVLFTRTSRVSCEGPPLNQYLLGGWIDGQMDRKNHLKSGRKDSQGIPLFLPFLF